MKKYIQKILLIPIIGLLFSGCYTTLWMPDSDYDTEDFQDNQEANYYPINDYGDYYYYYNTPWWYSAAQATQGTNGRNQDVNSLRKTDSGRGDFNRDGRPTRTTTSAPLPTVSAPAPAAASASTSSNSSKDNSGNRVESTSSSNNSSGSKSSNNSNPVRNNDGNRNTSGR